MGEFPSGERGQTVNLLSLTSMVRIHLLPPNKKHPEGCFFCLVRLTSGGSQPPAGGNSASLKCGRNLRFPHKRPLPDCGGAGWKSRMPFCWAGLAVDGSRLLWEGPPLRSNVVGTYGSPTNAPSLTVGRSGNSGGLLLGGAGCCWKLVAVGRAAASLKCGRNLRFPHKRPLPDCGEGVGGKAVRKILPLK